MSDLQKLRKIYQLKSVYRYNSVGNRKESSAEHTWSALVLANYFLDKIKLKLNHQKVYELLLYHDLLEIETGDIGLHKLEERKDKKEKEQKALPLLLKQLPTEFGEKFRQLFQEYEERKTPEAKFVKAIDYLDAELHELDYKKDWIGWTEKFLRQEKEKVMREFPELNAAFEEVLQHAREHGYFEQ